MVSDTGEDTKDAIHNEDEVQQTVHDNRGGIVPDEHREFRNDREILRVVFYDADVTKGMIIHRHWKLSIVYAMCTKNTNE